MRKRVTVGEGLERLWWRLSFVCAVGYEWVRAAVECAADVVLDGLAGGVQWAYEQLERGYRWTWDAFFPRWPRPHPLLYALFILAWTMIVLSALLWLSRNAAALWAL